MPASTHYIDRKRFNNQTFQHADPCRLYALTSRLPVDRILCILFKLGEQIKYPMRSLNFLAQGSCYRVFFSQP